MRRFLSPLIPLMLLLGLLSELATAEEMRTLEGRYVRIVTDLPETPENRQWTAAFDAAVPLWCEFWNVPLASARDLRLDAYVMSTKQPFQDRGLIPPELPDFPHGFQMGNSLWVVGQPSEYYTRHLLLHEGAHAFAFRYFGGPGPPWYMEGTAEFLATHRWDGDSLAVGVIPESRDAFPYWGRFKMIDQRRGQSRALSLVSVMRYSDTAHRQVEPYAWTWAAAVLMAMYPETRETLIRAARGGDDVSAQFTRQFVQSLGDQWPLAQARWRVLISEIDYGYDILRNRIEIANADPLWDGTPLHKEIHADQGWQSCGVKVPAGTTIAISAEGRVVIAQEPKPWEVEPQGVTIRYHQGHPIGQLMGVLLPTMTPTAAISPPLRVVAVGRQGTIRANEESWLLLKVGDSPAELSDNQGSFLVEIAAN